MVAGETMSAIPISQLLVTQVDSIMEEMQISMKARAEELEPHQFVELCHAVLDRIPENFKIL